MNLAKVAELTKVSPRMLRYYESLELIKPHRASNNYRSYTQKDIENINKIKILNEAGMTLKDIQVLLPCFDLDEKVFTLCPIVQEKLQTELMHVSEQLNKLQHSHHLLKTFLDHGTVKTTT
ncbi:MerR family transcriptional regulator [Acinetobacter sp.]|jgi:DNA-binding transcriptional MerR regulator|uniref:MerR family transcriptional regulator n=1 Tax=Acinetobacter sp. TaxID=472 RepID=UPI00281F9739|nr:MerR family transcriptional regulator [Acinetobacter sp.]MDR2250950.1 MerR family transcriptional regulator [Acinetobacter sp.]